jgi:type II secretory pathway component GspD/PulD (secretin)
MENIEKVINDFNAIFNKQIDFELDIYEFAVTKDFTYGVSVGGKITRGKFTYDTEGKMTNELAKSIFKITKKTSNVYAKVESVNNIVQLLQNTSHGYVIKNNMPYMIDLTNSKNYVKTITRTSTITNGVNSETVTPETDTISEGTILTVLPRIVGKRVELNIEPNIVTINKITKETYDGNTISLPDISTNKFKSNITMLDGEKRIIGYITQYQDISDYNGVLPLNHFIIGGENGKKYIRKEIVFVVGVRIKK